MACQGFPECARGCYCDEPRKWEGPMCFHCNAETPEDRVFDAIGETFCSVLCALLVVTHGHCENCQCTEAAGEFTRPSAASCRHCAEKLENALATERYEEARERRRFGDDTFVVRAGR